MPRPRRIHDAGITQHLVIRGNDRCAIFWTDVDRGFFLRCLKNAGDSAGCDVHAYVLMTNHVHILATARRERSLSKLMQDVGRRYVENANLLRGRTGTLLEGRFKATPVLTLPHALACIRYIEQNPVRARMVASPSEYEWSSCRHHLGWFDDALIVEHSAYLTLGNTTRERAEQYGSICNELLEGEQLIAVRAAPRRGRPANHPSAAANFGTERRLDEEVARWR